MSNIFATPLQNYNHLYDRYILDDKKLTEDEYLCLQKNWLHSYEQDWKQWKIRLIHKRKDKELFDILQYSKTKGVYSDIVTLIWECLSIWSCAHRYGLMTDFGIEENNEKVEFFLADYNDLLTEPWIKKAYKIMSQKYGQWNIDDQCKKYFNLWIESGKTTDLWIRNKDHLHPKLIYNNN